MDGYIEKLLWLDREMDAVKRQVNELTLQEKSLERQKVLVWNRIRSECASQGKRFEDYAASAFEDKGG